MKVNLLLYCYTTFYIQSSSWCAAKFHSFKSTVQLIQQARIIPLSTQLIHTTTSFILVLFFQVNSETPFSVLLFALSLPPLPCQHHVRPGRSMWSAAGIMLTFSVQCISARESQTSQSVRATLRARHYTVKKRQPFFVLNLPMTTPEIIHLVENCILPWHRKVISID